MGQIAKLLPRGLVRLIVTQRHHRNLSAVPTQSLNISALATIAAGELRCMLMNPRADAAWTNDYASLTALMPRAGPAGTEAGERRAIYYLIADMKPQRILEVGTHRGASTLVIAQALSRYVGSQASLVSLDICETSDPKAAANTLGLESIVRFVVQPAQDFLARTSERFDLIFLDGDHSAPAVYREVIAASKRLNPNGAILLHDYHPNNRHVFKEGYPAPGPYLAVKRLCAENSGLKVHPLGALPWQTRGGENATCLAILCR